MATSSVRTNVRVNITGFRNLNQSEVETFFNPSKTDVWAICRSTTDEIVISGFLLKRISGLFKSALTEEFFLRRRISSCTKGAHSWKRGPIVRNWISVKTFSHSWPRLWFPIILIKDSTCVWAGFLRHDLVRIRTYSSHLSQTSRLLLI